MSTKQYEVEFLAQHLLGSPIESYPIRVRAETKNAAVHKAARLCPFLIVNVASVEEIEED